MTELQELSARYYYPDKTVLPIDAYLTEADETDMASALQLAEEALENGNPPVGAILSDRAHGLRWGGITTETGEDTNGDLLGHAELNVYRQSKAGLDLSRMTLVTTAIPCTSCTPHYAEGKIGRVVYAAERSQIYPITGLMRPRDINFHELMKDGQTSTEVIGGFYNERSLALFGIWGDLHRRGLVTSPIMSPKTKDS